MATNSGAERFTIRPYLPKDRERLREICLATATPRVYEDPKLAEWILLMYNDYYTASESGHCFVAAAENDEAVGYVISAPSFRRYRLKFLPLLPRVAKLSKSAAKHWMFRLCEKTFAKEYPAHLHIDIFPAYHRLGLGSRLMDALMAHLKDIGVRGVMLGCGAKNTGGNAFYEAYGFTCLSRTADTVLWGMKLK
ncbi:MAG: GNAT family N-acetyltransferase [Clostridiales bacterium]|nr:GNAT family N-acetyltransferase [Clostridiales bacterium]